MCEDQVESGETGSPRGRDKVLPVTVSACSQGLPRLLCPALPLHNHESRPRFDDVDKLLPVGRLSRARPGHHLLFPDRHRGFIGGCRLREI